MSNDDDRDAGVGVRREPRSPNKAGGIAVPEPDDDQALNLVSTEQARTFMNRKRKIIVHIATSADGFIARPDGNLNGAMQVHYDVRTTR